MYTIFYSWQSDLDNKFNRNFIEDCLKKSIKKIHKSEELDLELNFERDTLAEAGTPDIVATIFKKILNSNIFLCDISLINGADGKKKTPNPNVLLELGYASAVLGWENIICVFNTAYGKVEDLPFDLRFRRPIQYLYDSTSESKNSENLINQIENAIVLAHPEMVENKKLIRKEFINESDLAIKIAVDEPEYWQLKLAEELFRSKLLPINRRYEDIDKNLAFKKPVNLSFLEFLKVVTIEMGFLANTTTGLTYLFNNDIATSIQSGETLKMLDAIKKYFALVENLIGWEIEVRSWKVSEELAEAKGLLLDVTRQLITATNSIPHQLKKVYSNPFSQEVHHIEIIFEEPTKMLQLETVLENLSHKYL